MSPLESPEWDRVQDIIEEMAFEGDKAAIAAERYIISKGTGYFGGSERFVDLVTRAL